MCVVFLAPATEWHLHHWKIKTRARNLTFCEGERRRERKDNRILPSIYREYPLQTSAFLVKKLSILQNKGRMISWFVKEKPLLWHIKDDLEVNAQILLLQTKQFHFTSVVLEIFMCLGHSTNHHERLSHKIVKAYKPCYTPQATDSGFTKQESA